MSFYPHQDHGYGADAQAAQSGGNIALMRVDFVDKLVRIIAGFIATMAFTALSPQRYNFRALIYGLIMPLVTLQEKILEEPRIGVVIMLGSLGASWVLMRYLASPAASGRPQYCCGRSRSCGNYKRLD
jgi:hypothetical protein